MMWHLQNSQGIRHSQHGFRKSRSCLTNVISFDDQVTCLVDEGNAVVCLDFSKAFDTISPSILPEELATHVLNSCTLGWVEKWLDGWVQRGVVGGVTLRRQLATSGVLEGSVLEPVLFHIFINDQAHS